MKLVFIFAVLLCANLQFSQAGIQYQMIVGMTKPSANIEAADKKVVSYQANQVIKDWSLSNPNSHLAGGMTYQDGKLTVPLPGWYYIYAQIYFVGVGRVHVNVNNGPKFLIQSNTKGGDGSLNAGGVYNLKAGDVITLTAISAYNSPAPKLYMYGIHTFFGAVLM